MISIQKFQSLLMDNLWVLEVFAITVLAQIINLIKNRLINRLEPKSIKSKRIWYAAFLKALTKPSTFLIWIVTLSFAVDIVTIHTESSLVASLMDKTEDLLLIGVILWFLIRFISESEKAIIIRASRKGTHLDKTTLTAVGHLTRVAVIVTSGLIGLKSVGLPVDGILAAGGIGGLAIGFASKDLLSNFFGGFIIFLDRPFTIGDWIRSPDKNIEGIVEHIGWRTTKLRTFDKRPLYVPNGVFSVISIENPSRMSNRRIKTLIGLRYHDADKVSNILKAVKYMLMHHEDIDQNQTCMVNFTEFGPSSLDFMVYTFTKTTDWATFQDVRQDVYLKILEIINKNDAQCAFPTRTVHMTDDMTHGKELAHEPH